MHRALIKHLPQATGSSELVIAVNVDIRGFTEFSTTVDSVLAALFLRKVYERMTEKYFTKASFVKPTGDGLLVVLPWSDETVRADVRSAVKDALGLVRDFPTLCSGDPSINFKVPPNLGVGLSRGSASRLGTPRLTLDYSGEPLNLASRLMGLARPRGVVFDAGFGVNLLQPKVAALFETDAVYLAGISKREPLPIYYTSGDTKISPRHRQPLQDVKWESSDFVYTIKEIEARADWTRYDLSSTPIDPSEVTATLVGPRYEKGKLVTGISDIYALQCEYMLVAGKPEVRVRFDDAHARMLARGVKKPAKFTLSIKWPVS